MFTKAILLNGQRPDPVVFPPVPSDNRKAYCPPQPAPRRCGTAFHFAICLIIHSAGLSLKLFLACSQPDLFWNAARSSSPMPPPPAAAPAHSFTWRKCQPPPTPILSLWNNGPKGTVVTWVTLITWLNTHDSWAPHCSEKEDCLRRAVSKQGCGHQKPQERFKAGAHPASLPGPASPPGDSP